MSEMYFEDHPTDPEKVIIRKPQHPRLDQGPDYERGFIDGMQEQMRRSVDKAVNAMAKREWVGLTTEDMATCINEPAWDLILRKAEQILKEKNT